MATKKTTTAKAPTKAKATRKKREKVGWYMDKNGKIPLDEFFKDEPKPAKISAAGLWLQEHPDGIGEILDMRAVLK